jgi:hypothetical protein
MVRVLLNLLARSGFLSACPLTPGSPTLNGKLAGQMLTFYVCTSLGPSYSSNQAIDARSLSSSSFPCIPHSLLTECHHFPNTIRS